jgi:transposase
MEISVSTNQKQNGMPSAGASWAGAERRAAERSEADRSGAPAQLVASSPAASRPSPEVVVDARRRTFSLDYKLRILKEAEAVKAVGGIGALLRREGLYSSHLTTWRQERETGMWQGLTPKSRGPKRKADSRQDELQQLRREVQRLSEALQRAETIIDVQKKLGSLLGWAPPPDGKT